MKTNIFLFLLLADAMFSIEASDNKAIALLDKAAQLHGLSSPNALSSFEMETVYSSQSGGMDIPSRWLSRVDFNANLDLGVRFVYDRKERGIFFQRRIEGKSGTFLYGIGASYGQNLNGYLSENEVGGVSNISLLAIRSKLVDQKYEGWVTFGDQDYEQVSFTYHGGHGTVFFTKDGHYAGFLEKDLRNNKLIYNIVTSYKIFDSILVPNRYRIFGGDKKASGYGRLLNFRANPKLSLSDFEMKPSIKNSRGWENKFGLVLLPANAADFEGLVIASDPDGPSKNAGLIRGDQIIGIDGRDVTHSYFYDLEEQLWETISVKIIVLRKDGSKATINLTR